ncbi:PREDICTED: uncharacterized protein LOC109186235 [Ipomoea nil]|uniref:uncharacterized protein LOC109186235 n=1 Tax=Ipomoea nil TaxID=35883 RepID=UPI000900CAF4|nr:PREDICTED: uncharacterized protein LOC109186235 [Ipomoea nil]
MVDGNFTWVKGRGTESWVEERLDRAIATVEWMEIYEEAVVRNLFTINSDHNAILVDTDSRPVRAAMRSFRFESAWLLEEGFAKVVGEAWHQSTGMNFQQRIALCGRRLWRWGGEHYQRFGSRIKDLRSSVERLKEDRSPQASDELLLARGELELLMQQEEVFWRQRSKQLWMKHGDSNTKYFHKTASARRRRNLLLRVKDPGGTWKEGTVMHTEILRYFNEILCSENSNPGLFHCVQRGVTDEMNGALLQPFTIDESVPEGLNASNIVFLPKKKIPERVSDLRPIALCNVIYKILAKMLANRMKGSLTQVVSQSQSAIVPERLLTDNIILASEIGHYLRKKTNGVVGWVALKLDMAKAYDRMEWAFLEGMLGALGFDRGWIELLMLCVSTVSYSIQVNGEAVGTVCPTRGIRQGDPLSPYLFIICAEGLSILLQQAEARGDIHSVRVSRGALAITHLFFADDNLLFFRANQQEVMKIKECLDRYSEASGQRVNFDKSIAVFSLNTVDAMRSLISSCLGVRMATDLGRYLGLPSVLGRNKSATFRYIEEKVRERIGSWQNHFLSRAGKEVLLKSIVQSMPIFTMSTFLLPLRTCDILEKLFNRFWWGGGATGSRGIHWTNWRKLCEPKLRGGLGFKRLHEFNLALLAKQGWRIVIHLDSLVSRLLKAKYFPNCGFMEAKIGGIPSYIWRSILAGQEVLKLGLARRIGDGVDTKIWGWPWLANSSNPAINTPCVDELQDARVSGLLTDRGCWDAEIVSDIFQVEDVQRILTTPVNTQFKDSWRWLGDLRGMYTVKHGYRLITSMEGQDDTNVSPTAWKKLWSLPVPPKVRNLLWRCARGVLPVRKNLKLKRVWIGGGCPLCGFYTETVKHLFGECNYAREAWGEDGVLQGRNLQQFMDQYLGLVNADQAVNFAAIFWVIWEMRNDAVWRNVSPNLAGMCVRVAEHITSWKTSFRRGMSLDGHTGSVAMWKPPPTHMLKCNVDAVVFSNGAGIGAVVRDHGGRFVAVRNGSIPDSSDPLMAEAIAAKEALTWIKSLHYDNIILESDCLNFCNAFNSRNFDYSYVGLIVKQCRCIANDIGNIRVCHVKRSANRVAHELARATDSSTVSRTWDFIPPLYISNLLSY